MGSKGELKDWMREHLFYEWLMLHHTLGRAATMQASTQQLDFNAYLESFGIHARVLYGFLTNDDGKGNNNVVASDFVPGFKEEKTDATKGIVQRLNPQLAHAGKRRTADASEKLTLGRCGELYDWIVAGMDRFTAQLDDDFREVWTSVTAPSKPATLSIPFDRAATATNVVIFAQSIFPTKGSAP